MDASSELDIRLDKLETTSIQVEGRLGTIERTQAAQSVVIEKIHTAVTLAQGRPQFDIWKAVSSMRDIFAICAIVGSLSVWLVLTLTAANNQAQEIKLAWQSDRIEWANKRLERLEASFSWVPRIEAK